MKNVILSMALAAVMSGSALAGETQGTNKSFFTMPAMQKWGICAVQTKGETQGTNKRGETQGTNKRGETQGTNKAGFSIWDFFGFCGSMTKGETQGTNK